MIDIYDNLEDYEEISNYEQLKSENQELKLKLDQCEAARRKLQQEILQDFDKLSAEHNILLQNFSSLLKTARAEVERKTDTITHINAEKDKLFLSLMSDSTNKVNPAGRRKSLIRNQSGGSVEICDLNLGSKSLKEVSKEKNDQLERKQSASYEHQTQTQPKIKAANSVYKVANEQNAEQGNKENEAERKQDTTVEKYRPCSIRNRRKSMPALRHELSRFSSDEEDDITSTVTQKLITLSNEPKRAEQESERNKVKYRSSEASNLDDHCSDTRQLGSKTRSQTKSHNETLKDKHGRQSRYDVHESYRMEERNKDKLILRERRGRSSYGRLRESRHRSRGSHREYEDYDYRQESDRHASPSNDKYHRHKSRDRRFYERDQSYPNFEGYKLSLNEKPKQSHPDKRAQNFENNIGRNVETYHEKPDDIPDQHKQSRNKAEKDDRNFDRNYQIYEKNDNSSDSNRLNSIKKLAERDKLDELKITQAPLTLEKPNLCDKSKKYKIPKIRSEKAKQDVIKKDEKYDHAIDKYNTTSHEKLAKQDDFERRVEVHQERPISAVDLKSPISYVNLTEKHHDLNRNVKEHSLENHDYEIDSHKITHRERLAKKHDYDLERNLKTHRTSEELHDFDKNVQTCDKTPTEELVFKRNRPCTVFDRRMTRNMEKQSQPKVLVDIEEPVSKRRRPSSYIQTDEVYCHENVTVNVLDKASVEFGHRFGPTSCQSPDDIRADNVTADESMREIMNTAETKLEDPRYTSNRYMAVGDTTSKIRLSVSSRHVHLYKLCWPLDIETKSHQIPEHTAETKSQESHRESTNEQSNQNKSYERSPEINPKETEIEIDNNVLNESLESGEIEDVYSDLITTAEPNESNVQTAKPQTSTNFGIQRKDDTSQTSQSSIIEEMRKCRKDEIPKIRPDIVNAPQKKDSSMPLEELLKPSSSNCSYIHNSSTINTELLSFGVSKEPESLKARSGTKLNVPQLQDSPMPLAELFKPSRTDNTASNKQHTGTLVQNLPNSSSEAYKIPKKNNFEKNPVAPENRESKIFEDCSSNKQTSRPHTFDIKPQKRNKVVTDIRSGAEKNKHCKSDDLQLKESKNLQSRIIDTPAKKSLVQGDLELSDEDSDNCDLQSQNTLEKLKSSSKNDEIKKSKKKGVILESKDSKQKSDKTGKEIENSKTTEVNGKFCDLFGESSLITPEDLEIPPESVKEYFSDYVFSPISESAQMTASNPVQVHEEKTNKSEKNRTRSGKVKKDLDNDKKTHQKDDKKSRKVSKSTTDKVKQKSEKHVLPKKRKSDEKPLKPSTENACIVTIDVDAIKVIPEKNDNTAITSPGKQPPPTVSKNNDPIIFTNTPKLTQISEDSMKSLETFTSARVATTALTGNSSSDSADRTTGNDTSTQHMTNHVAESNTIKNEPDVRIVMTRRKRKRISN